MDIGIGLETTELEAASASLDALVERRSREEANGRAKEWKADVRKYNQKREANHQREWLEFHLRQALAAVSTAAVIVENHRQAAGKLTKGN